MFHFFTPWKCQKTFSFLTFSGGIEMEHWAKKWNIRLKLFNGVGEFQNLRIQELLKVKFLKVASTTFLSLISVTV